MMLSTQHVFCVFILIPIPTQPYGLQLLYRLFLFCNKICSVSIFVILFFRSGYTFHISETVDKFMHLRGSGGVVAVLVLIGEVVRLRRLCGVHLLHLGERFAHPPEGHRHLILRTLRLTVGPYQAVKVVVSVSVVERTAEFCLAAIAIVITIVVITSGLRRVYGIGNTQDIVHSIVLVLVFHHSPTVRRKVHRLQTFTLFVVGVGCFRAVAELGVDGMAVLVITYPVNNNAFMPLFIARKANYLSCCMVGTT